MKKRSFLVYCPTCQYRHRMTQQPCPACSGRGGEVPMPISTQVANRCHYLHYYCDGCEAYRDHQR